MSFVLEVWRALKSTFAALVRTQRSALGWCLYAQGAAVVGAGLLGVVAPHIGTAALLAPAPADAEAIVWVRAFFGVLSYIGALYLLAGAFDDGARSFGQIVIALRILLMPPLAGFLLVQGLPLGVGLTFLVGDPLLALLTAVFVSSYAADPKARVPKQE